MALGPEDPCPCGGGAFGDCCGPLLAGAEAPTALALMRSRYTAFVLGATAHLLRTWHAERRPPRLDLDEDVRWRRLQIVDTARGGPRDATGVVEFRAAYRRPDGGGVLHERSRFSRVDGRWTYVDGDPLP